MNLKIIFLILFFIYNFIDGQQNIFEDEPGYILVSADSIGVPIYIDGDLVGHTPLKNPLSVYMGRHYISHHSPSLRNPFIQYGKLNDMKEVYVISGDTVKVHLNTYLLNNKLDLIRNDIKFTRYVGIGLTVILVWQLFILSG